MTTRQASVFVADDFTYSLNGKFNLFGVYTADIAIVADPSVANQLVFLFEIETPPDEPFESLELSVTLPGGDTRRLPLPLENFRPTSSDKIRWNLKYPLLFPTPTLRPGPIEAKVIHEKGEISVVAPVIALIQRPHSSM
jgi:hypothetical protein